MDWLNIVGAIGGSAGIVALIKAGIDIFNARSNRNTVDISNMEKMLKDSMDRCDKLEQRFDDFMHKTHEYVQGLRGQIVNIEDKAQKQEERINNMEKVINLAWRCKYPQNVVDCPVIQEYEKRHLCENCATCNEK